MLERLLEDSEVVGELAAGNIPVWVVASFDGDLVLGPATFPHPAGTAGVKRGRVPAATSPRARRAVPLVCHPCSAERCG